MKSTKQNIYIEKYGQSVGSERGFWGYRSALRTKTFLKYINPQPKEKILEIGCNNGILLFAIQKIAPKSLGVDVNKEMVNKLNTPSITYMSATELTFPNNSFDKIYALDVIEHIQDTGKVFRNVHNILKTNGVFTISFPFELIRGQSAMADALRIYNNPLMARKLHVHKFTPKRIQKISKLVNFEVVESRLVFIPFPAFIMQFKK